MAGPWPLGWTVGAFLAAAIATALGCVRIARAADALADRIGVGEALFGALFFGGAISLSGIVMTATAASDGLASLAYSNAVGGIAAQTAALGVADMAYRQANLEHAAASLPNMFFATLLIGLLGLAVLIGLTPEVTVLEVHPGSALLVLTWIGGYRVAQELRAATPWLPRKTQLTVEDTPHPEDQPSRRTASLWAEFVTLAAAIAGGGYVLTRAAESLIAHTGLEQSFVGAVFLGIVNAIPETVTSVAAVRRGALSLAVASILGGNAFDVLNLVVGDVFYRDGSLYHAAARDDVLVTVLGMLMTATILAGLLRREQSGPANIGLESVVQLTIYIGGIVIVAL